MTSLEHLLCLILEPLLSVLAVAQRDMLVHVAIDTVLLEVCASVESDGDCNEFRSLSAGARWRDVRVLVRE